MSENFAVEFHDKVIGPIVNLANPTESLTGQTGHLSDTRGSDIYEQSYYHKCLTLSLRRSHWETLSPH